MLDQASQPGEPTWCDPNSGCGPHQKEIAPNYLNPLKLYILILYDSLLPICHRNTFFLSPFACSFAPCFVFLVYSLPPIMLLLAFSPFRYSIWHFSCIYMSMFTIIVPLINLVFIRFIVSLMWKRKPPNPTTPNFWLVLSSILLNFLIIRCLQLFIISEFP